MNRIREVDSALGYAIVEPGVTQQQLFDYLQEHRLPFFFNVTGSGSHTSLIGNTMERGVGYFDSRVESAAIVEVVLGTGAVLRPGFGHFDDAKAAYLYRYGVGPDLGSLFYQSNFGIVTALAFQLMPRRDLHGALFCGIRDDEDLPVLIDTIGRLRQKEILTTAVHIANRERTEISVAPVLFRHVQMNNRDNLEKNREETRAILDRELENAWSAVTGVMGTPAMVKEAYRQTRRALRGIAKVQLITEKRIGLAKSVSAGLGFLKSVRRKRLLLDALTPFFGVAQGVPTDAAMGSVYWPLSPISKDYTDPDSSDCGLLYCLPIVPLSGSSIRDVVDVTNRIYAQYGFEPYMTFNVVTPNALEGVINLAFDRSDPEAVERAHHCIEEQHDTLIGKGYIPYRVGIHLMDKIADPQDSFWQLVRELKSTFDPEHIIAPGRYNLV
jgi:4-cresol dehydrogenase (hydroxylating)